MITESKRDFYKDMLAHDGHQLTVKFPDEFNKSGGILFECIDCMEDIGVLLTKEEGGKRKKAKPKLPVLTHLKKSEVSNVTEKLMDVDSLTDIRASTKKQDKIMSASIRKAKKAGTFVGRFLSFGVADGHAVYEVACVRKDKAFLRHVPIGDAYCNATLHHMSDRADDPHNPDGELLIVDLTFVAEQLLS